MDWPVVPKLENASGNSYHPQFSQLRRLSFWFAVTGLIQAGAVAIAGVWVALLLPLEDLATYAIYFPVGLFILGISTGIANGAGILFGQSWGSGENLGVSQTACSTLVLSLVVGVAIAAIGISVLTLCPTALGLHEEVAGRGYFYIMIASSPIVFLCNTLVAILRSGGNTTIPTIFTTMSLILNVLLIPLMLTYVAPHFGDGLIWVSFCQVAVWLMGLLVLLYYAFVNTRFTNHLRLSVQMRFFSFKASFNTLRVGLPTSAAIIGIATSEFFLLRIAIGYGDGVVSVYGAIIQVMAFVQFPLGGISGALSVVISQEIGKRQLIGIEHYFRKAMMYMLLFALTLTVLGCIIAPNIAFFYFGSLDSASLFVEAMNLVLVTNLFYALSTVYAGCMRGSGDTLRPNIIVILSSVGSALPVGYVATFYVGPLGVWGGYAAYFLILFLAIRWYFYHIWVPDLLELKPIA